MVKRAQGGTVWLRRLLGVALAGGAMVGCGDDGGELDPASGGATGSGGSAVAGSGGSAVGGDGGQGDGTGGAATAGAAYAGYTACDETERVGGFSVLLTDTVLASGLTSYSSATGLVRDAALPSAQATVLDTAGDCRLLQAPQLECVPACVSGQVCGLDGACAAYPSSYDLGAVTIEGLADPVEMEARLPKLNYVNSGSLTHPVFGEGDPVRLSVAGGDFDGFALDAEGVAELGISEDARITVADGQPVELSWTPPATAERAHVLVTLNISLHGGDPVRIECDAPDTGALTIPASLISQLLGYSYSGFPAIDIVRQTASRLDHPLGCIDFRVGAQRSRIDVEIPGLVSCNSQTPCPDGGECDLSTMRCL